MQIAVEFEQEEDGRWIAEIVDLPGVMAYGRTKEEAKANVKALFLQVLPDLIVDRILSVIK
jgi:predicted RNase H-like HicB family nuclease